MDYTQTRAEQSGQIGRQEENAAQTRRLNPEDIELARKKVELGLYLEKAASLEKEFAALRRSLIEFRDRFIHVFGTEDICRKPGAPAPNLVLAAFRPAHTNTILFPAQASPPKAEAGAAKTGKDAANAYLPILKAVREELRTDVLTTLLDRAVVGSRKIPSVTFTLITGTAPAHYSERPSGSADNGTGDALITAIRDIYNARERILFLHRGITKLRFSMLHRLMTEVQEAGKENFDLLSHIAGSV